MYILTDANNQDVIVATLKEVLEIASGLVGVTMRPATGKYLEPTAGQGE